MNASPCLERADRHTLWAVRHQAQQHLLELVGFAACLRVLPPCIDAPVAAGRVGRRLLGYIGIEQGKCHKAMRTRPPERAERLRHPRLPLPTRRRVPGAAAPPQAAAQAAHRLGPLQGSSGLRVKREKRMRERRSPAAARAARAAAARTLGTPPGQERTPYVLKPFPRQLQPGHVPHA